ncbi:hypothetical protein TRIUR3_28046 [Triticum urartu]|uniref:Uncharacterized protein n=1 Tax=Triticum urartu TaxID=4572 RepID=M7XKU2_TRIUA|nr:hypothetical protein TRIUR3_28046 [Triticum urartu]
MAFQLDPWELLKKHVLSDYVTKEIHQLTVGAYSCRSILVVLGLAEDQQQQPAPEAQSSQNQAAETSSSAAEATTEVTQESSAAS